MPAARYWRLTAIETYDMGDLELSEIALYNGASRVDASATLGSVLAPASGTLTALSDVDFGTTVRWTAADTALSGFAITWDFGSSQNIDKIGVAGPTLDNFAHNFVLSYSTDQATWTRLFQTLPSSSWKGSTGFYEIDDPFIENDLLNTSLLLRGAGANGSTAIADSSLYSKTLTVVGGVQIATAQKKFGSGSISFPGTVGSYLQHPWDVSLDPLLGDFTIEAFVFLTGYSASYAGAFGVAIFSSYQAGGSPPAGWQLRIDGTASAYTTINVYTGNTDLNFSGFSLALNTWHHVAASRSAGQIRAFVNGVQVGSTIANTDNFQSNMSIARPFRVGHLNDVTYPFPMVGFIDELRMLKGVAAYTTNFTPPVRQHGGRAEVFDPTPLRQRLPAANVKIVEAEPLVFDNYHPQGLRGLYDREDGGDFRIVGTVKEVALPTNTPLSRRVRLAYQDNGRVIRETFSDAAGNYVFDHIRGDRVYVVTAFDYAQIYRPVAADQLIAEAYP